MLATGDIPPLGIVVSRRLVQIVRHPTGEVILPDVEQSGDIILAAYHFDYEMAGILFHSLEQTVVMVVQVDDFTDFAANQLMERAGLQQGVSDIFDSCRGKADTHVIKIVDVVLQVFFREVARYAGQIIQHPLPVDVAHLREFQQGGYVPVDFEKHDI